MPQHVVVEKMGYHKIFFACGYFLKLKFISETFSGTKTMIIGHYILWITCGETTLYGFFTLTGYLKRGIVSIDSYIHFGMRSNGFKNVVQTMRTAF